MNDSLVIPYQELDPLALNNLLEEYISRAGTDYGEHEYSMSDKVTQLLNQLKQGIIVICYDPDSLTCNLLEAGQVNKK